MNNRGRAVVLVSGGLDSTTCLGLAVREGLQPIAVTFLYGQRHNHEVQSSEKIVKHYGIEHHLVFEIGLFRRLGGNALTGDLEVPRGRAIEDMGTEIPPTYVPARNLVFLSYALGVAERHGADQIFIGVNALDYSGYPDCRPDFVRAFENTANLATRPDVAQAQRLRIRAPLLHLSKAEIIRLGISLSVPYHLTHTCYGPELDGASCGRCDACLLRLKGFTEAGLTDPITYATPANPR